MIVTGRRRIVHFEWVGGADRARGHQTREERQVVTAFGSRERSAVVGTPPSLQEAYIAHMCMQYGRAEDAQGFLDSMGDNAFEQLAGSRELFNLSLVVKVVAYSGDETSAAKLYELLEPHAHWGIRSAKTGR